MILSADNKQLLKYVHEHRLVQPWHMHQLGGWDVDYLQHRMPAMVKEKYLKRITWEREGITDTYAAYQLDRAGMRVLAEAFSVPMNAMRFKKEPTDTRWIKHALLTTDSAVALRKALPGAFDPFPVPLLKTDTIHAGARFKASIVPDHAAMTAWVWEDHRLPAYLEADVGTMPIYRSHVHYQQSIYKKLLGYLGLMRFRGLRFFVLIVTKSPTRCRDMPKILQPKLKHLEGDAYANLILFNHEQNMQSDPVHTWINLAGEQTSLLPER